MPPFSSDPSSLYTSGDPAVQDKGYGPLLGFGASIGALGLLGNVSVGGKRGWDYYLSAIRGIEEYSPGRVLRTFGLSQVFSPFETAARQYRYFSPEIIDQIHSTPAGRAWLRHLERVTGQEDFLSRVSNVGFRFEEGKLVTGATGGDILLERAGVTRNPYRYRTRFTEAYAKSVAGKPLNVTKAFTTPVSFIGANGTVQEEAFAFVGGKNRLQAFGRALAGYGTFAVERFNRLASAPFEVPFIGKLAEKVPGFKYLNLGVKPSSGLKTFGKLALKIGVGVPLALGAYKTADWAVRNIGLLDNTILDEGITAAGAALWTKGQLALSTAAEVTGLHSYRERQEEIAPGSTSLLRLAAFPLSGVLSAATFGYGQRLYREGKFMRGGLSQPESIIASEIFDEAYKAKLYSREMPAHLSKGADQKILNLVNQEVDLAASRLSGKLGARLAAAQSKKGFWGAAARLLGDITPGKTRTLIGAAAGAALVLPFVPGALIPEKRPDELRRLYSGQELEPVRKGRWWLFGRSPYEGERVSRYQLHWYPRLLDRSREEMIYGGDVSPLTQFYRENFTYDVEQRNYWSRPYPVTAPAFQNIPLVGPILGATIGKIVKPQVFMHRDEMIREDAKGEEEILQVPLRFGQRPPEESLGEVGHGMPMRPDSPKGVIGEQTYRMTEMVGLPGFVATAVKERLTGTQDLFDKEIQFDTAGRITASERSFWEEDLGDIGGLGEFVRRLVPHERRQIERWNAIPNAFANVDWLPGEGERSENFKVGDPFSKVPLGEYRLPGPGLALKFPELKGVAPEEYGPAHRLAVLGDIAPYSEKYKEALVQSRIARAQNQFSEREEQIYKETLEQVAAKKRGKEFQEYKYSRERRRTPVEKILAAANEDTKAETSEPSWFESTVGSYWERITHTEGPLDVLTPLSPMAKFVNRRTAIEDYERTQVYGTNSAFWSHPIRDFIKPFITRTKRSLGSEEVPERVEDRRAVEEYFDILEYVKATKLSREALAEGDIRAAKEQKEKKRETLFGINPYTYNFSHLMRALPRRDRDYFKSFSGADMEERAKVLKLIPDNERALYIARWQLKDANDLKKAIKKGLLSEKQLQQASQEMGELSNAMDSEGLPKTTDLWKEYITTRLQGESYPDWYRRTKLLSERLEKLGMSLPGPDWVGFSPLVDLEDIKLKVVENMGEQIQEYDLWQDRQRQSARKPHLPKAAAELEGAMAAPQSREEIISKISSIFRATGVEIKSMSVVPVRGLEDHSMNVKIEEDRRGEIKELVRRRGLTS